jgi:hypothetical protein
VGLHGFLFFLMMIYPDLVVSIFEMLDCERDPRTHLWYAREWPASQCTIHSPLYTLAAVALLIYAFGIPLLMLLSRRHQLEWPRTQSLLGFMYHSYRAELYYWEVMGFARRLLLVLLLTFVPDGAASALSVQAMLLVLLVLHLWLEPFAHALDNWAETFALLALTFAHLLHVAISTAEGDPTSSSCCVWRCMCSTSWSLQSSCCCSCCPLGNRYAGSALVSPALPRPSWRAHPTKRRIETTRRMWPSPMSWSTVL